MRHSAFARFSHGSGEQAIWTRPTLNFESVTIVLYDRRGTNHVPSGDFSQGMRRVPASALVLFDIDGTLIRRAGPHHRQALVEAVRSVTGLETTTDHIPVHGMLDPDILTRMMLDAEATPSRVRRAMPDIIAKAQALYVRRR